MISGASEEELEIANDRADLLLEIDRLNNIISELEKYLKSIQLTVLRSDNRPVYKYQEILDKLKELKEKE